LIGKDFDIDSHEIVTITHQGDTTVDFKIKQVFGDVVKIFSVYFHDSEGSIDCNVWKDVTKDVELSFSAYCVEGVTDVSVHVNVDGSSDVSECENCLAPSTDSTSTAAYYFKLDCEPICVPDEVTSSLTEAPTPAPQATLKPDGSCYNGAEDETGPGGLQCAFMDGMGPITGVKPSTDGQTVNFKLKNTFAGCSQSDIALRFETPQGGPGATCFEKLLGQGENSNAGYVAKCEGGLAEVEVYASCAAVGDSITDSGSVSSKCSGSSVECAHVFVLPCTEELLCDTPAPTESPVVTPAEECVSQAVLDSVTKIGSGDPNWPEGGLQLEKYDDEIVTFSVKQLLKPGSISWISVMTDSDGDGIMDECEKENGFDPNEVNEYTTKCDPAKGSVTVQVNLHDGQFKTSDNKNTGVCDGWPNNGKTSNVASYEVIFKCECSRRMREMAKVTVDEPSTNLDDMPYCVSEDFPCEGEEANMVYVCHYSARKGYQTFCVPEADSDILRFYAHDYCGPCEGGQGVTWGEIPKSN
jgi:hypothetical protein